MNKIKPARLYFINIYTEHMIRLLALLYEGPHSDNLYTETSPKSCILLLREPDDSQHQGGPIEDPPKTPQYDSTVMFRGV